jgi:hypothetical protein
MFSKCAAFAIAVLLHLAPVQAEAFDPSLYYGEKAFEIMVTGDVTPILQADDETRNRITLYAMGVAGKLQFLWSDRLSSEFNTRALFKVVMVSQALDLDDDGKNNLLSLGALDGAAFAEKFPFDSSTAQSLIANLTRLMEF